METLGQYLKREREFRQISLREVATATRIGLSALQALEEDRCETLPGEVFVRGYLKSYARHIGLDLSDVLLRYDHWRESESEKKEPELPQIHLKKSHQSKAKYLWLILLAGAILALAAYLSSP